MTSASEELFNKSVADVFVPAYLKETGVALTVLSCGKDFPDLSCQKICDRAPVGIELVEVVLSFINQEKDGLQRFETLLAKRIVEVRPVFKGKSISLQVSHAATTNDRPHRFPHYKTPQAKAIADEFITLLKLHSERILTYWGGLLTDLTANGTNPPIATLLEHFDAILINNLPESYAFKGHRDDAVINLTSTISYVQSEVMYAVQNALMTKAKKGASYTTDILVLHSMKAEHKSYYSPAGFHPGVIAEVGRNLAPLIVSEQFKEVWYLESSGRLHRLL